MRWLWPLAVALGLSACKAFEPGPMNLVCGCEAGAFAQGAKCHCALPLLETKPYTGRVFSDLIKQANDVQVDGTVSVTQGAVKVSFEGLGDERHEVTARPGAPAKLSGRAAVYRPAGASDDTTLHFEFRALDGSPRQAKGITLDFDYRVGE